MAANTKPTNKPANPIMTTMPTTSTAVPNETPHRQAYRRAKLKVILGYKLDQHHQHSRVENDPKYEEHFACPELVDKVGHPPWRPSARRGETHSDYGARPYERLQTLLGWS